MGEIADAMLDGTMCSCCGEYLGEGDGFPMMCSACSEDEEDADDSFGGDLDFEYSPELTSLGLKYLPGFEDFAPNTMIVSRKVYILLQVSGMDLGRWPLAWLRRKVMVWALTRWYAEQEKIAPAEE